MHPARNRRAQNRSTLPELLRNLTPQMVLSRARYGDTQPERLTLFLFRFLLRSAPANPSWRSGVPSAKPVPFLGPRSIFRQTCCGRALKPPRGAALDSLPPLLAIAARLTHTLRPATLAALP